MNKEDKQTKTIEELRQDVIAATRAYNKAIITAFKNNQKDCAKNPLLL